jgi:ABC-type multidrug transport system fused ATPase/permease subunit
MSNYNILTILGMFLIPLILVLIPILLGQRYGQYLKKRSTDLQDAPIGSIVGAVFGLFAFMLAFTFQIASGRYNDRKELLLEDVTQIRTAYLRAGLIPEPFRSNTKKLLVEYVDLRVEVANNPVNLGQLISRSQQILDIFWNYAETLAEQDRSSEVYALYTTSINDLIDLQNKRITMTFEYRIPAAILWILFVIAFFSMFAMGFQFGLSGKGNFSISLILAVIFALVMFLIFVLDRPETGLAKLNQKPMLTLQKQLQVKQ